MCVRRRNVFIISCSYKMYMCVCVCLVSLFVCLFILPLTCMCVFAKTKCMLIHSAYTYSCANIHTLHMLLFSPVCACCMPASGSLSSAQAALELVGLVLLLQVVVLRMQILPSNINTCVYIVSLAFYWGGMHTYMGVACLPLAAP